MSMLYVLIALALALLALAVWALFWAISNRQFDDLESQGWSVVLDDDQKPPQGLPAGETGQSHAKGPTSQNHPQNKMTKQDD